MVTLVSSSVSWRHLRSATHGNLAVPCSRMTRYGQRRFAVSGPTLCDPSLTLTRLKTVLFCRTYITLPNRSRMHLLQMCLLYCMVFALFRFGRILLVASHHWPGDWFLVHSGVAQNDGEVRQSARLLNSPDACQPRSRVQVSVDCTSISASHERQEANSIRRLDADQGHLLHSKAKVVFHPHQAQTRHVKCNSFQDVGPSI